MKLPEGYRVERDPDVWTLYGPGGEVVARFVAGAPDTEIERAVREHERGRGLRELAVAVLFGVAFGVALGWGSGLDAALW